MLENVSFEFCKNNCHVLRVQAIIENRNQNKKITMTENYHLADITNLANISSESDSTNEPWGVQSDSLKKLFTA